MRKEHYGNHAESICDRKREHYENHVDSICQMRKKHCEKNVDSRSNNAGSARNEFSVSESNKTSNGGRISNSNGRYRSLDINEIKGYLTNQLKQDHLENLIQKVKDKFVISTVVNEDKNRHRAHICVVCDCLIIGMEEVKFITKEKLMNNTSNLCVSSYEQHFDGVPLHTELVNQYQVEDDDLKHLLLSPRAFCDQRGYECCESCHRSLVATKNESCDYKPPKFAIANGFAIGHIPETIAISSKNGEHHVRRINAEKDLDDLICAAISPVRPFGYVHAYTAGRQKSIKGHFSLFSVDQSHVGGALHKYRSTGAGKNIYVVLCGRMTPEQKTIVRRQAELNTDMFMDLLNWFIKESGHGGYQGITPPDECPNPVIVLQEDDNDNSTDTSMDSSIECKIQGKTYYFSSEAQNPT
jgi:hypothetical protein